MATYKGIISGTGDSETRENEITGDELAIFRNFVIGYADGVLKYDNHDFDYSVDNNIVHITDGMCFAYGYMGYSQAKDFSILLPAVEQYYVVYVRLDKSVIPNGCGLFIKNNYASPNISANLFRQDQLSTIKTGVYEIPLWLFKVTNKGVDKNSFVDLRSLKDSVLKVGSSDEASIVLANGKLENGVTAVTQAVSDNSKKAATTAFVQAAVQAEINK